MVEYAAAIPGDIKFKNNQLKYLMRKVAARYLPPELIERKKQGFAFPLAQWMRTDLREFITNLFACSRFVALGIFDPSYMSRLLDQHVSGQVDHNYRLWLLINLEIWYRLKVEGLSLDAVRDEIARLSGPAPSRPTQGDALRPREVASAVSWAGARGAARKDALEQGQGPSGPLLQVKAPALSS